MASSPVDLTACAQLPATIPVAPASQEAPICRMCKGASKVLVSKTEKNKGREFHACVDADCSKKGYICWVDEYEKKKQGTSSSKPVTAPTRTYAPPLWAQELNTKITTLMDLIQSGKCIVAKRTRRDGLTDVEACSTRQSKKQRTIEKEDDMICTQMYDREVEDFDAEIPAPPLSPPKLVRQTAVLQ